MLRGGIEAHEAYKLYASTELEANICFEGVRSIYMLRIKGLPGTGGVASVHATDLRIILLIHATGLRIILLVHATGLRIILLVHATGSRIVPKSMIYK